MDEGVTVTHPNLQGVWTPTVPDGISDPGNKQGQDSQGLEHLIKAGNLAY